MEKRFTNLEKITKAFENCKGDFMKLNDLFEVVASVLPGDALMEVDEFIYDVFCKNHNIKYKIVKVDDSTSQLVYFDDKGWEDVLAEGNPDSVNEDMFEDEIAMCEYGAMLVNTYKDNDNTGNIEYYGWFFEKHNLTDVEIDDETFELFPDEIKEMINEII